MTGRSVAETTFLPFTVLSSPLHSTSLSPSSSYPHSHSYSLSSSPSLSPSQYLTLSPSTLSSKLLLNNTNLSGHTTRENTEANTRENSAKNSPRKLSNTSQNRSKLFLQKPQVFSFHLKEDLSDRLTVKNREREVVGRSGNSRKETESEGEEGKDDRYMAGSDYRIISIIAIFNDVLLE
jgi:hypothetical protein